MLGRQMKLLFWQYRMYFGRRLTWKVLNVCTLADEREDGVDRLPWWMWLRRWGQCEVVQCVGAQYGISLFCVEMGTL